MLPLIAGLRVRCTNVAGVILQACNSGDHSLSQLLNSGSTQLTLWPAQQYRTAKKKTKGPARRARHTDSDADLREVKSKSLNAVPVQPTHQILKVVLQSDIPLTSMQLYEKVREEFGGAAFPTRRYFKTHLHQLQQRHWVKATAQRSPAVGSAKPGRKAGAKADNFVFISTTKAANVDLDQPGSSLQQQARAAANKWTERNLGLYKKLLQEGRIKPTVENLELLPAQRRPRLFSRMSKNW